MRKRMIAKLTMSMFLVGLFPLLLFASNYDHTINLGKMEFSWALDGDTLNVMLRGDTEGWIAVGFNASRKMKDANIIIGYVKSGKTYISDEYGNSFTQHKTDTQTGGSEDIMNVSGIERRGATTLSFSIPIQSGDSRDSRININGDTTMIFAYGTKDSFRSGHTFRSTYLINLATGEFRME